MEVIEIKKPSEDLAGFFFVIKAMVPEKEANPEIAIETCVKIEPTRVTATDRARCHIYQFKGAYKPGIYRAVKRNKTHIVLIEDDEKNYRMGFPDIDTVFNPGPQNDSIVEFEATLTAHDAGIAQPMAKIIRALPSFKAINPAYLKDIDDFGTIFINPELDYIIFENGTRRSSIALVKVKDNK